MGIAVPVGKVCPVQSTRVEKKTSNKCMSLPRNKIVELYRETIFHGRRAPTFQYNFVNTSKSQPLAVDFKMKLSLLIKMNVHA